METITRKTHRRATWLTVAAALVFAAPTMAQPGSTGPLEIRPPQPLPPPKLSNWPDFPAEPLLPPPPVEGGAAPARKGSSFVPKNPIATTSAQLPAFSGFGANGGAPKAGSFPQPDAPPSSMAAPAPEKVWTVQPVGASAPPTGVPAERLPRDFGNGFKSVVNQKIMGREGPAAALAPPRNNFGPRPDWSWHGYEHYDHSKSGGGIREGGERANSVEMAPYMKYAHQWRPSTIGSAIAQARQGLAAAAPPAAAPAASAMTPSVTTAIPATHSVTSEPATRGPVLTPSISTPLPNLPDNSAIQNTEFRAVPVRDRDTNSPRDPLPPLTRAENKAKVVIIPPPEVGGANRLPLAVRERVSAVCAGKCRNLAVEMLSPVRLRVAFLVKDQVEAEMLTTQLSSLPELGPYKVDFEVQIGQ